MSNIRSRIYLCPIIIGIILIIAGLFIQVPGGALTTYKSLNGESAEDYYVMDNTFSTVDEYVGGDAYNYIIGATLIAGKTAGIIASKAICIVGGCICLCIGLTILCIQGNTKSFTTAKEDIFESSEPDNEELQKEETAGNEEDI